MSKVEMIADDSILEETEDPRADPEAGKAILHLRNGDQVQPFQPGRHRHAW